MVDERAGRAVLKRVFEQAGIRILEEYPLMLGSYKLLLDGYDPERRIGYEYVTTAGGDREALHEAVIGELDRLNETGLMHLFLVDEQFIPDEETLAQTAADFLQDLFHD